MEHLNNNSEAICTIVTMIIAAIIRRIEKRKLKKAGKLND
jgi:hypothetical protein